MDRPTFRENCVRVTNIAHHLAWIVRGCSQFILVRVRIVSFVRSVVPRDVQLLAALKRSPGVIRNYRDAAERLKRRWRLEWINGNSLTYTCDLQGFLIVVRFHFAAENGRALYGRVHHAVQTSVHPIHDFPSHEGFEVVTHFPLAYISPGALRLEFHLFFWRDWEFRRSGREFTVIRLTVRSAMHNNMQIGFTLSCRDTPLMGGSLNQHESRRCPRFAHRVVERADRMRPVSILVTVSLIADGLLNFYALPIRIQFISDNQR